MQALSSHAQLQTFQNSRRPPYITLMHTDFGHLQSAAIADPPMPQPAALWILNVKWQQKIKNKELM